MIDRIVNLVIVMMSPSALDGERMRYCKKGNEAEGGWSRLIVVGRREVIGVAVAEKGEVGPWGLSSLKEALLRLVNNQEGLCCFLM